MNGAGKREGEGGRDRMDVQTGRQEGRRRHATHGISDDGLGRRIRPMTQKMTAEKFHTSSEIRF